jgi:hypothetical protein
MMASKIAGMAGMGSLLALHVACSSASAAPIDDPKHEANVVAAPAGDAGPAKGNPTADAGAKPGATTDAGTTNKQPPVPGVPPGEDGLPDLGGIRQASNEHCCFNGQYLRCPDANACFGGFDINACLQNCRPGDACFEDCFTNLGTSGAPKGCDANAPQPPNVDCANGRIDGD